uniref:Uncharacterized protein n=1 Tax=Ciona savignyi TaxID=51511 RepID=H2YSH3_CIOSA
MSAGQSIIHTISSLSPTSASFSRKACFIGICICVILYYLSPLFFKQVFSGFSYSSAVHYCTKSHLMKHLKAAKEFDVSINHFPVDVKHDEAAQLPFVGNGKLALLVKYHQSDSGLYLFFDALVTTEDQKQEQDHKLIRLAYDPLLKPEHVTGSVHKAESSVVNFRNGIVEHLSCFSTHHGPLFS